ncbi:D-alanyl-D-alanine carboxypeptidase family protein [Microbulbifer thermotolerans]|uniref:serine-type D-Ala-D-Ala carboxypeptidase n=1 Tax=Microbulbifer thermotolerans TaxID=252514 RepID=A0A143HKB5_MICTH|nr:D-alanyl-D-alanine carboxypeptidase family protein [Microbulbifer thermotolerans]AMX01910.1 D-alanyl-D-alanine carboxypeptidase [Microbulbifer thermotolerans]MCX2779186.1 D-alanyl-D-alanine carboxypeptidase [Microbulbifer thermotolerans]MCX2793583.1 D-alanyl-D-alanine carboxypeptidase [Microbulbifer thermotolerans]MCX2801547.1 D-alanyl-D-alanine carboxypeptidase [Microbulbifer thermotolerans]MCX2803610.1 D-alanyl-D-alanine carboxypeptidase [Microbulbifer thermotolerans]
MMNRLFACTFLLFCVGLAHAQSLIPAPPQLAAEAYLLLDAHTGQVLVEHNADKQVPPASLTKMMTAYIVSDEIEKGTIKEEDMVRISEKAWRKGGSKMFVKVGDRVPVIDLLRGVIVQSGNDASIALAEHVSGSEEVFAEVMNQQAELLGMKDTHFVNATGWPAEGHLTTARDLGILARALVADHPAHYKIYSEKYFSYAGINQPNRNRLLWRDPAVDGIKTGHTEEAGYCLVASAVKRGMRLIAVVLGTDSDEKRASETQKLLAYGFRYFQTHKVYSKDEVLQTERVWGGKESQVGISVEEDVFVTIPRGGEEDIKADLIIDGELEAPLTKGQPLGKVVVTLDGETVADVKAVAAEEVEQAGFFKRLWDAIKRFVMGLFG